MAMRIDSHQHFWRYSPQEYGWIGEDMAALRRDFLPEHLEAEIRTAGMDGTVAVQARQSLQETSWLLELADRHTFIRGVVGWADLRSANLPAQLERLAARPKLRALRHVVQDEPDDEFLLRDDFNRGVAALADFGLRYDILIFERHLSRAIRFVDRHPRQVFVLDHLAKPRIRDGLLSPWRENLIDLARRPNVFCKLSGLVTEADPRNWTPDQLRPYLDAALEAFGSKRLMFGSDWPVCLAACEYRRWLSVVEEFLAPLSDDERTDIFGRNAVRAYGLPEDTP